MSLIQSNLLRSFQTLCIHSVRTSTTGSTKKSSDIKKPVEDESFLEEVPVETEVGDASTTTGRERSLNRIQLIGRVGADPKVGGTQRHKVVTFNLATNEYAGTNTTNGEVKQRVDWHRVAVFQPRLLENAEKYIRQGDRLYVQGRLHHNLIRDKVSGDNRYVASIIADDMIFLTKK